MQHANDGEEEKKKSGIDVTHTRSYNMLHHTLAHDSGRFAAWLQKRGAVLLSSQSRAEFLNAEICWWTFGLDRKVHQLTI
jgi:hypothetical protein